jgi:phytoene/squalene synthetase
MRLLTIECLAAIDKFSNVGGASTSVTKSNFRYTFLLLSNKQRIGISNIYVFAHYLDHLVDTSNNKEITTQQLFQ